MTPSRYKLAVNILTSLFSRLMLPLIPEAEVTKSTYKLYAGFIATDRNGAKLPLYPIGPDFPWLVEAITGKTGCPKFFMGDKNPIARVDFTGESAHLLVEAALQDPIALEATKELVNYFREQGRDLPEVLYNFSMDNFTNKTRPKYSGKNRMSNFHRNLCIIMCISALEDLGFGPISKSSTYLSTLSLCDAVEEALKSIGINRSYEAIKSVWKDREFVEKFTTPFHIDISKELVIHIEYDRISTLH